MSDPRLDPAPDDHIDAVQAFSRDFAYGVMVGDWLPDATIYRMPGQYTQWNVANRTRQETLLFDDYINAKWNAGERVPDMAYMDLLGYFEKIEEGDSYETFRISQKGLDLLTKPALPPQTFIAYYRDQSSAFALLIEARLKEMEVGAFIDKQISAGDDWRQILEQTIKEKADYFICLIAPGSIGRAVIREEIRWALETRARRNIRLIPIWHNGFSERDLDSLNIEQEVRDFITSTNAIKIVDESAQGYETGLSLLLNRLAYR